MEDMGQVHPQGVVEDDAAPIVVNRTLFTQSPDRVLLYLGVANKSMLLQDWIDALQANDPAKAVYCATTGLVDGDVNTYMLNNKPTEADAGRAPFPYKYRMLVREIVSEFSRQFANGDLDLLQERLESVLLPEAGEDKCLMDQEIKKALASHVRRMHRR